jgi:hypothetical protein
MLWKNEQDQQDWLAASAHQALRLYMSTLDEYRFLALDIKEITITSFIRKKAVRESYHAKGQALDIRTRDMTFVIEKMFLMFAKNLAKLFNESILKNSGYEIQVVAHEELRGKPQAHIHIELDDGNPV